ncbi:Pyrimidine-specific ribonucleoside hydrolase RihB [Pseudovibrio axinellae]|uniref:Pyrimidine-specific ribonucleoside hydrolase RihB n=1 Tax=Pseudovibrio axinellae TaxID=989403 RepID=A0A165XLC9_9HYPH|nr:nucleoside hydrolase [Pseudovibrio axinellae]KZL17814.1 Pyrimidine-specific ribonucleoside hydrolase RihB [Pseudovibrio axinellae]SEP71364.1 purine nucleosidase/ribosylpyrimidine nucleosidase [Pseudovibrio axinellae]
MKKKLILDVDTGTDDAVAIMLAALHEDLDLVGVTTVNGNAELHYCTDNSLRVLDFIGKGSIPVYAGCVKPIVRSDFPIPRTKNDLTEKIHGKHLPLPETKLQAQQQHAVEYLVETYRSTTDPISLVPVAPLTNIAAALAIEPKLVNLIPEVVIMGGGHDVGNVTPAAEFNIWADPEAAYTVFNAGFEKLTMVPLDATHKALVTASQCIQFGELGTPAGQAMAACTGHRIGIHDKIQRMDIEHSAPVHDALCIAHLIQPEVITLEEHPVDIETHGELSVGRTIIDKNRRGLKPVNCKVAFDADAALFVEIMMKTFAKIA